MNGKGIALCIYGVRKLRKALDGNAFINLKLYTYIE